MGAYYIYVNDTKRCYFFIDPTMVEIKRSFVGNNIGSRILSLLLLENNSDYTGVADHPMIGSWIGDRFYITADDYATDFQVSNTDYENVGQRVLEMIATCCPFDLLHFGGKDWMRMLVENESEYFELTVEMAKQMLRAFGEENKRYPTPYLERIVTALKNRGKQD